MQKKTICFLIFLLFNSGVVQSQERRLDKIFKENFAVQDSVVKGTKFPNQLNHQQSAFLYILSSWTHREVRFDHNVGFSVDAATLEYYRLWYATNSGKIDVNEFDKAFEILLRFFKEGLLEDADIDYLDSIGRKYRQMR